MSQTGKKSISDHEIARILNVPESYYQTKSIDRRLLYGDVSGGSSIDDKLILDVGCGSGIDALIAANNGGKIIALDIHHLEKIKNPVLLKTRLDKNIQFLNGDGTVLPFKSNSFDVVYSFSVLDHIPTDELRRRAIKEFARVLKKGGRLVITGPNLLFLPNTFLMLF